MKRFLVASLICLVAMSAGAAPKDIVLGLTIPVTGPQAAGGLEALSGTQIAVDEINKAGGVKLSDGFHKVKIIYEDDRGDTTLCDTTVRRLVANGAIAILGPYFSGQTLALDATMRELKVPLVNSATSIKIPKLENPWIWRCRCDDGINVLILGKAVMNDYKAKNGSLAGLKVGILCANDETGTSAANSYKDYFDKNNVKYYADTHNKDETDLTAYVQKAIAAGCNAWVSSTHDIAAPTLAKAMYQLGLRNQIVYMNPILAQTQVLNLMQPEWVEGWGCASDYAASDTRPLSAAFTKAFNAKFKGNPIPDVQAALYYSHATVILNAIKDADSLDSPKIRDAIAKTKGLQTLVGKAYASKYTNLIYEISVAKIRNLVPTISGSVSMADDFGF
ncbi:ABC transporter substrate-binding protein [bacterium]|nr:ABC transporter substrate-binding protein [bacterium]